MPKECIKESTEKDYNLFTTQCCFTKTVIMK